MATGSMSPVSIDSLPTLCRLGVAGNLSDAQLLESFLGSDPESSAGCFRALVDRHGPMVLRVCRQVLDNPADADDAFQATFLVLLHQARSVRKRDSIACWLYGIALRIARRSRANALRRRLHETRRAASAPVDQTDPAIEPECWPELHDELRRLPERFRESVVLCYFEGMSTEAAAKCLGCAQGTVLSRLSRARERLRQRLSRRALAVPMSFAAGGLPEGGVPSWLARAVEEAAERWLKVPKTAAAIGSTAAVQLAQQSLQETFVRRAGMLGGAVAAVALVAAGAGALLMPTAEPGPEAIQAARAADPARQAREAPRKGPDLRGSSAVPANLQWNEVPAAQWLDVLEMLAARSRSNYGKIKTWKGSYRFTVRQYLNKDFVTSLPVPSGKAEPLMQEFEFGENFALDTASGNIYRDKAKGGMRFLRIGTNEAFAIKDVGPGYGRSIVTADRCLEFRPDEQATTAFLPDHPDAQNKRIINCYPLREHERLIAADAPDPRGFFKTDPGNQLWSGAELYAQALRGRHGMDQFKEAARRLTIHQADGPGGRWYWEQTRLNGAGTKVLYSTAIWSPQAGCNPVLCFLASDRPDGPRESMSEWHWKLVDGIRVPSEFRSARYRGTDEQLSHEAKAVLAECALNQPLDPHQFDYQGLGAADGDVIVDYIDRIVYAFRNGKPVKLGRFVR
jgi:RNA polymerase sigma factor (sigma-70 family)